MCGMAPGASSSKGWTGPLASYSGGPFLFPWRSMRMRTTSMRTRSLSMVLRNGNHLPIRGPTATPAVGPAASPPKSRKAQNTLRTSRGLPLVGGPLAEVDSGCAGPSLALPLLQADVVAASAGAAAAPPTPLRFGGPSSEAHRAASAAAAPTPHSKDPFDAPVSRGSGLLGMRAQPSAGTGAFYSPEGSERFLDIHKVLGDDILEGAGPAWAERAEPGTNVASADPRPPADPPAAAGSDDKQGMDQLQEMDQAHETMRRCTRRRLCSSLIQQLCPICVLFPPQFSRYLLGSGQLQASAMVLCAPLAKMPSTSSGGSGTLPYPLSPGPACACISVVTSAIKCAAASLDHAGEDGVSIVHENVRPLNWSP